jgi:hypothetical protein
LALPIRVVFNALPDRKAFDRWAAAPTLNQQLAYLHFLLVFNELVHRVSSTPMSVVRIPYKMHGRVVSCHCEEEGKLLLFSQADISVFHLLFCLLVKKGWWWLVGFLVHAVLLEVLLLILLILIVLLA